MDATKEAGYMVPFMSQIKHKGVGQPVSLYDITRSIYDS